MNEKQNIFLAYISNLFSGKPKKTVPKKETSPREEKPKVMDIKKNQQKKSSRSFEEIGLLFGLAGNETDKQNYLDNIEKDITSTRSILDEDLSKLKDQFNELIGSTKSLRKEIRSLITDLDNNRNNTVIKLSKTIRALIMESDFDAIEKKEIINKVLDEGVSTVASIKESIIQSQKSVDEMIKAFLASSPHSQFHKLYEVYLQELKVNQTHKSQLQKGFAAGLAIKNNIEEIEKSNIIQEDEEE